MEEVRGVIQIRIRKGDGWIVGSLKGTRLDVVGVLPADIADGSSVVLRGEHQNHSRFGEQFKFKEVELDLPRDEVAIVEYLSSNFPGVGAVLARRLFEQFGEKIFDTLEADKYALAKVQGITKKQSEKMFDIWNEKKVTFEYDKFFTTCGLTTTMRNRLLMEVARTFKMDFDSEVGATPELCHEARSIIENNPYTLIHLVEGIGFKRADLIAKRLGFVDDDPRRVRAALLHVLQEASQQNGHCCLPPMMLISVAQKLLGIDAQIVWSRLDEMLQANDEVCYDSNRSLDAPNGFVALTYLLELEKQIAKYFQRISQHEFRDAEAGEQTHNWGYLTGEQREAVRQAAVCPLFLLTGLPGTGKTFTLSSILSALDEAKLSVLLAAPTGKAAKRMTQQTGRHASTIHRLLGFNPRGGWGNNEENPIDADVVIIDECFDYRQPILTEHGWWHISKVSSAVRSGKPVFVWSVNPNKQILELKRVVRSIRHVAPASLLKISVGYTKSRRSAKTIRCTLEHKIYTTSGRRRAGDLRVGDMVIIRGRRFTKEQKSIVLGSLLGDGSLFQSSKRTSPQVTLCQGEDQKEYFQFKYDALQGFVGKIQTGKSGFTSKSTLRAAVDTVDEIYELAKEMRYVGFRPGGRRIWAPAQEMLNQIDAQALAIWYLDNGSLATRTLVDGQKRYGAFLHTQRFDLATNHRIAKMLNEKFKLFPKVAKDGRGNYLLRFSVTDSDRLLNIVEPFVPSCMTYKTDGRGNYHYDPPPPSQLSFAPVFEIKEVKARSGYVHDLEVQDNHNYIAGNVVVSNCSMIDVFLAHHLLQAIGPRTSLILVGDPNQLPSVGPGRVFNDLIDSGLAPNVHLTQIMRQAEGSLIIQNAHAVHLGRNMAQDRRPAEDQDFHLFCKEEYLEPEVLRTELLATIRWFQQNKGLGMRDIQVLCPTNKEGRSLSTSTLNPLLRQIFNPLGGTIPGWLDACIGDRVMQIRNNYRREIRPESSASNGFDDPARFTIEGLSQKTNNDTEYGVFNGEIGVIEAYRKETNEVVIRWDDDRISDYPLSEARDQLKVAYAISVHKSQGSEFPLVCFICHRTDTYMLHRNLLYTAITRAQNYLALFATPGTESYAIGRNDADRRMTNLKLLLIE